MGARLTGKSRFGTWWASLSLGSHSRKQSRNSQIDTVRGVACILLVYYHTEVALPLVAGGTLHEINEVLRYVRMPLFTFLSGYVYAMRPVTWGGARDFTGAKVKRLLIPFVFVSLLFAVSQKIVPATNFSLEWRNIPEILIWPHGHFWFLAAIFVVFIIVQILEYSGILKNMYGMIAVFLASSVLFLFRHGEVGVFAWNRALYLLPFFLAGLTLKRFGWNWAILCAALGGLSLAPEIPLGVAFALMLVAWTPTIPFLAIIGTYSYSIYLWHVFGTAGARIALQPHVDALPVLLLGGTVAGLALPIAIHLLAVRVPYLSRALLGVKPA